MRVIMKFGPHLGRYMMHCHNLVHEDHDMMVQFEVGQGGPDPIQTDPARPLPGPPLGDTGSSPGSAASSPAPASAPASGASPAPRTQVLGSTVKPKPKRKRRKVKRKRRRTAAQRPKRTRTRPARRRRPC